MPELPDITIYIEALQARLLNQPLEKVRLGNPFLLRTFDPPIRAVEGKRVIGFRRIGKRIVFEVEDESLNDTLLDLLNYSVLLAFFVAEEKAKR